MSLNGAKGCTVVRPRLADTSAAGAVSSLAQRLRLLLPSCQLLVFCRRNRYLGRRNDGMVVYTER